MLSLANAQALVRAAVIDGDVAEIAPALVGGLEPHKRLTIHQRHYETSLVTVLLGKFPATGWLVGTPFVEQHARTFVHRRPPHAPCVAEYGCDFPEYLSMQPGADRVPYLRAFAELESAVGAVSIATDQAPLSVTCLSTIEPSALPDVRLRLQSGLRLLHADWPVDDLFALYVSNTAPEQLELEAAPTWLQVCGNRGAFGIDRLTEDQFLFRQAIVNGASIGEAAATALERVPAFEPGSALSALFAGQLVTAIATVDGQAI